MNRILSLIFTGTLAVLATAAGAGFGFAQESKAKGEYAGSDTCAACHEEEAKAFNRSAHAAVVRLKLPSAAAAGCESCHGPGKAHAEDQGQPIFTFKNETAGERSERCLACHAKRSGSILSGGVHQKNGVACDTCHMSGHGALAAWAPKLLRQPQAALCVQCHGAVNAQIELPFRHKIAEGVVRCSDCHDAHGRPIRRTSLLSRDRACVRCHGEKQGPFPFEHDAATVTGCMSCHTPHGSTNPKLLARNQVMSLCLECHPDTTSFHNLSQGVFRNCTACHVAIHGSYADRTLLR